MTDEISLEVRRTIAAPVDRVFAAWTRPELVRKWWGPAEVQCTSAEIDLRVGGRFKLANQLPDGSVIWIGGEFLAVEPPGRLVYTWQVDDQPPDQQQVTVRFEPCDGGTEVIVLHERMTQRAQRESHEYGWNGCLDRLRDLFAPQ